MDAIRALLAIEADETGRGCEVDLPRRSLLPANEKCVFDAAIVELDTLDALGVVPYHALDGSLLCWSALIQAVACLGWTR